MAGLPVSQASRAAWLWVVMSSLPPKPPPFWTWTTFTRALGSPRSSASWWRSS